VGVVSVPFKATSSDLNRVSYGYFGWFGWKGLRYPKRNIIKRREPRDVIAQAQAPKKVVGPTVTKRGSLTSPRRGSLTSLKKGEFDEPKEGDLLELELGVGV
jgi:hypothetical protein